MQINIASGNENLYIVCQPNDTIESIKKKIQAKGWPSSNLSRTDTSQSLEYITKNKIKEIIHYSPNEQRLLFEGSYLSDNKTLKDYKITNGSTISMRTMIREKGPPVDFIDPETASVKSLKFSKNAPEWRKAIPGLNLFGICQNKECMAFQKEIIHMVGYTDNSKYSDGFNFNEEVENILCPICKWITECKTCGLYKCEYQFVGERIKNGKKEHYDSKNETAGNNFEYFNPDKKDVVRWTQLVAYVFPKQKLSYK